jgi:hypothetical protein
VIVTMSYGDSQEHEAPPTIELNDLPWNTHLAIRQWMNYPIEDEFFADWLIYFYEVLSYTQRRALRKTKLDELDRNNFPNPLRTTSLS